MTLPKPTHHSEEWEVHCTAEACIWKGMLHSKGTRPAARALAVTHRDHTGHTVDVIGTLRETFAGSYETLGLEKGSKLHV